MGDADVEAFQGGDGYDRKVKFGRPVTDLYAVLGVARNADRATIRRAYWKLASRAHPGADGSRESFTLIETAHDVLTDDVRRRRYDETGEMGVLTVDSPRAQIIEILSVGLDLAMLKLSQEAMIPKYLDMVRLTGEALRRRRQEWSDQRREFEKTAELSNDLLGRFEADSADNLMETVLERRVAVCQIQIDAFSSRIKLLDDAIEVLNGMSFRAATKPEPSPQEQWISMLERFSRQFG